MGSIDIGKISKERTGFGECGSTAENKNRFRLVGETDALYIPRT